MPVPASRSTAAPTAVPASPRTPTRPAVISGGPVDHLPRAGRETLVLIAVTIGALGVVSLWWHDTPAGSLHSWGPRIIAAGDVTALVGTYLVVIQVLLMARIAWLDRLLGMDRLAVWHRRNGQYAISLLVAHALFTIWGYALTDHAGPVAETKTVVLSYPDVLAATAGLGLLVVIAITSARAARRRLKYQTWYFIHLYTYLAIALSFAHQLATGNDFATHPLNRAFWVLLYVAAAAMVAYHRVLTPLRRASRHDLRVANVVRESPTSVSIYVTGRDLGELRAEAGQFFLWRFLTKDGWWQAHPFSLSAAPRPDWLRLTVKSVGDHSRALRNIPTGTRVLAEGPFGAFTARRRTRRKVLMIAGGIGITPVRALFETLPGGDGDLMLIYRVSHADDLLFRDELHSIADHRGATVHEVVGSRDSTPDPLGPEHLRSLCPDVAQREAYICGPDGMVAAVRHTLEALGVPRGRIHSEEFAY